MIVLGILFGVVLSAVVVVTVAACLSAMIEEG